MTQSPAKVSWLYISLNLRFVAYAHQSLSLHVFTTSVSSMVAPTSAQEALTIPDQKRAMDAEMLALHQNGTQDLVHLPFGKSIVGCRQVYTMKYLPNEGSYWRVVIATPYVSTRAQVVDMFTKPLCKTCLELLCNKLGLYDMYAPT